MRTVTQTANEDSEPRLARSFLFCLCGDRNKASSRVRGYWLGEIMREQGIRCTLENRHSKHRLLWFWWQILFHDVVIFQKVYSQYHYFLLLWAHCLKKTTILDLDDAPSRTQNSKTLRNVERMMSLASAVTVGSQALLDYTCQFTKNVHLVPSNIYLKYYQPDQRKPATDLVCLGWIGNGSHYKQDLIAILKQPLTKIAQNRPIKLKLIGACGEPSIYEAFSNIPGLTLDCIDQLEWSNPQAISSALTHVDIGLYPLLSNAFNQYKCGFKALEYMAMEIPMVSSDIAGNREIIEQGVTGLFAQTPEEWIQQLEYLLDNETARLAMGRKGRVIVEDHYSIACTVKTVLQAVVVHNQK